MSFEATTPSATGVGRRPTPIGRVAQCRPLRRVKRATATFGLTKGLVAALIAAALAFLPITAGRAAQAAPPSGPTYLEVNTTDFTGSDSNPGDGKCATATNVCTLRAAIEEANVLGKTTDVVVTVASTLRDGSTAGTITANATASQWMATASVTGRTNWDTGAYYRITAPMTIDLENRLALKPAGTGTPYAVAFYVDAANVKLRNFTAVFSNSISIFAGPKASGLLVEKGTALQETSNATRRYLLVQPGADNVTFRDYTVGRLYSTNESNGTGSGNAVAAVVLDSAGATTGLTGLTIERVRFESVGATGNCSTSDGRGCSSNGLVAVNSVNTNGLTIRNCTLPIFAPAATRSASISPAR